MQAQELHQRLEVCSGVELAYANPKSEEEHEFWALILSAARRSTTIEPSRMAPIELRGISPTHRRAVTRAVTVRSGEGALQRRRGLRKRFRSSSSPPHVHKGCLRKVATLCFLLGFIGEIARQ